MTEIVIFGLVWIALSLAADLGLSQIKSHTMYFIISRQGHLAEDAFNFLAAFLIPVAIFVALFLVYTLIRFRASNGDAVRSRQQTVQNKLFVTVWVALSFALNILFWLHPTAADLETMFRRDFLANNRHDLVVDVTARQWEWIFSLPQYHITQAVNRQGLDALTLPVGRRVEFVLRSYDPFHSYDVQAAVIHSFWVPAFGIKEDVVPGETRYEFVTPTRTASYATNPMVRVQCAEVCGPGHAWMEAPLSVVSGPAFDAWVKREQKRQQG
ncbi:MAG: cytochrome c oxidase subunit II [Thermaerobacter sp.]|nr:cytochrome c oxidase subunit II [Thermaerobacter sp.]